MNRDVVPIDKPLPSLCTELVSTVRLLCYFRALAPSSGQYALQHDKQ